MSATTYTVVGMTCGHCVTAVTGELSQVPGVRDVQVDLGSGAVTVTSDRPLDDATVASAIEEAGYQLSGPGTLA